MFGRRQKAKCQADEYTLRLMYSRLELSKKRWYTAVAGLLAWRSNCLTSFHRISGFQRSSSPTGFIGCYQQPFLVIVWQSSTSTQPTEYKVDG